MGTVLSIANAVADELSIAPVATLFGEALDDGPRRMRRAIERTCQHLLTTYDWQQTKRNHQFLTMAGQHQPRAVPVDFLRFVPDTMYDQTRRMPMCMAESDRAWADLVAYPQGLSPRWVRRGNDIWFAPGCHAGLLVSYDYIANTIGDEPAKPHAVAYSVNGAPLPVGARTVVRSGHTMIIPPLGINDQIEMVPEGGFWITLGVSFDTVGDVPIINRCPPKYRDWVTLKREQAGYVLEPVAGYWAEISIPTSNGMLLEPGRRYIVGQGHIIYLPILAAGEFIELVPSTGTWHGHGSKFVTRTGTELAPPQMDATLVNIIADMSRVPAYEMAPGPAPVDAWGRTRPISKLSADTDVLLWDDELVVLGVIWSLNYRDGQPYGEDFRAFERCVYDRLKGSQGYGKIDMNGGGDQVRRPRMPSVIWA